MDSGALLRSMLGGFLQGLLVAWPAWLILGLMFAAKVGFQVLEARRLGASGIADIDRMDGQTFEKYLAVLFGKLGYAVERTRYIGDYGADLVVRKDGVKTVIQAKRHQRSVGVKAIQEAVVAKGHYGCTAAMVVTNSRYTQQAQALARSNDVVLWDRDKLVAALLSVKSVPEPAAIPATPLTPAPDVQLPAPAPQPSEVPDCCSTCGKQVSEKVLAYCRAHAERFSGQVYCYEHQRAAARNAASADAPRA